MLSWLWCVVAVGQPLPALVRARDHPLSPDRPGVLIGLGGEAPEVAAEVQLDLTAVREGDLHLVVAFLAAGDAAAPAWAVATRLVLCRLRVSLTGARRSFRGHGGRRHLNRT